MHRILVKTKCVRVADTTGQDECVVVGRADLFDGLVDLELVGLVVVIEPLNLAVLDGHQFQIRTGALQSLPRPSQLNLLFVPNLPTNYAMRVPAEPALVTQRPFFEPRQIIMARQSRAGFAAGVRLGGFEPPTRGLEGRRSVH